MGFRVGIGVDAHAFGEGGRLVLGGVELRPPARARGPLGRRRAGARAHRRVARCGGLEDIGALFPSDDERYRDADSVELLGEAYGHVQGAGYELVNADCVLIGEEPRIAAHRDAMRARLASVLGVEPQQVAVRATTTDRLGFTGRGEGLAAQAVALLRQAG